MFGTAYAIARTTFIEAVRQPVFFMLVLLAGLGILLSTWGAGYSLGYSDRSEASGDEKVLLELAMATVFVSGTLLAGFLATATLSREIENKTVLTIVSKPVPRPLLVIAKYVGVTGAVVLGVLTMCVFLLFAMRHKVMTTAADEVDMPAVLFSVGPVLLAAAAGIWCNFFYNWSFPQTFSLLMSPLVIVGYFVCLLISKKWQLQPLDVDMKPQSMLACLALLLSMPVLCAVATAASTRLGQVMTIVVCFGVFVLGLLSGTLFGRKAHVNEPLSMVGEAAPTTLMYEAFDQPDAMYELKLKSPPDRTPVPGESIYYGASPNGFDLAVPPFPPFEGSTQGLATERLIRPEPGIVLVRYDSAANSMIIKHIGSRPLGIERPPREGDFLFNQPTRVNVPRLLLWGVLPNLQSFWLMDAVSQKQPIPPSHLLLVGVYTLAQVTALLSLAVVLFQRRDVG